MSNHNGAAHAEPDHVDRFWCLGLDHLVIEDELLHDPFATAAVLLGPRDADVSRFIERLLPPAAALDETLLAFFRRVLARSVRLQPGPDLIAKRLLGCVELEVHWPNLDRRAHIGAALEHSGDLR